MTHPCKIVRYFSLVKFGHTIFSLPFALIGFFYGYANVDGLFDFTILIPVLLALVFARNAAMGFNRLADAVYDASNPRTVNRELPSKKLTPLSVRLFIIFNVMLFILMAWFINEICFILSPVALMVILGYSYTKRFTWLSHFFLGLGLALAPIGAYLSVTGDFDLPPVLISVAVLFWVAGFDIIYALQDEAFDRARGLRSLPAKLGAARALLISSFAHIISVLLMAAAGLVNDSGYLYWAGLVIFSILLLRQHIIVKPGRLNRVNAAFFTSNGLASILFMAFTVGDILLSQAS